MHGNSYIVYEEANGYCVSLWVIAHCVSCSQHLVVVVSENAFTAPVWNSNGIIMSKTRLWRFKF